MAKTVGSLPSLVQGVSEQEPHNRAPGKMWESVNMVDSITKGKARRRGTTYSHHVQLPTAIASALVEARAQTEYTFIIDGREYALIYRSKPSTLSAAYFAQLLDKESGKFFDIVYEGSTWVDDLIKGGVSALVCIGRYVYLAGNITKPRATSTEVWNSHDNLQKLSAWVREGAYSRKFTVVLYHVNGSKQEYSYTTLPAAYPELLDTTDIPFWNPSDPTKIREDYQKDVNDRVNAYEGEKSAWIKKAAEDIVPANIAAKLAEKITAAGIAASSLGPCVLVDDPNYNDIRLLDDGAGTLVSYAGKEVSDPQFVTLYHWAGKVVRVRPSGGGDKESYYLKAVPLESGATGWTKVEWVETAGVVHTIHNLVSQLVIDPALGKAYIAQNGEGLKALAPQLGDHPVYKGNAVGDSITAPLPHYFGRTISCMTVFQDRLMIAADNIVSLSRSSDYLNFFRTTVLNLQDNDPIEIFAHGSEGDTIKRAVMFERDLVLFGELRQYAISGREFLSPTNPNINVIGNFEGGVAAQPIASGNFMFFGKHANERTGLHQMQPGDTPQTTVVYEVSQELDTWIAGEPVQLLGTTMPNTITYRTDADPSIWYTYRYADEQSVGRVMSSWGKMQYAPELGTVAAITHYRGDLYVITLRSADGHDYWFADKLSLNVDLASYPHLDSQVRYGQETPWHTAMVDKLHVAADKSSDYFLLGATRNAAADFIEQAPGVESALVVGAVSPAYFQLTNPYMRDSQGQPVLNVRRTLVTYIMHLADTGGMNAYVLKPDRERTLLFEGRVIGHSSNIIGRQPVFTGSRTVSVGKEIRACIVELRSEDWQPLRVTGAEWSGQDFMPRARGLY